MRLSMGRTFSILEDSSMKTLKIIFAILLILAFLPVSGCSAFINAKAESSEHKVSEDMDLYLKYGQSYKEFLSDVHTISISTKAFMIFSFLGILSAIIIVFTTLKKKYGGLLSGGIVFALIMWAEVNKILIQGLENHTIGLHLIATNIVYQEKDRLVPYGIFNIPNHYSLIQGLLALPAIGLLLVGLFQLILPRMQRKKESILLHDFPSKPNINNDQEHTDLSNSSEDNNIEQLKKYKHLLDEGIITEEEFETKKKQLLNL